MSTTDPDSNDSHTYSLVSGSGDTDNASFSISGSSLLTAAVFDYETKNSYSIRVRSTDSEGTFYEKAFTVAVIPKSVTITTTDSTTTEAGGTGSFTVFLNSEPTSDVTITVTSSDTTEGIVSPSSLTFTSSNYATAQSITITGVDDNVVDGSVSYSVSLSTSSSDSNYNGISISAVSMTNTDDDTLGVTVTTTDNTTTEAGGTGSFNVFLNSEPTSDVTITVTSSDTTEGTVSSSSLTFTSSNYSTAQTITVTGVDDSDGDGDIGYSVTMSASSFDSNYNGISISSVSLTNVNDELYQQAYLKASNNDASDEFGYSVAMSNNTIVVGAYMESSNQTTITNGSTTSSDNSNNRSGAAYVFKRSGSTWSHEAYLKAPNSRDNDDFGYSVAIDGDTIVVGARDEDSNQTTITNGSTASSDSSNSSSGAAYVFKRSGSTWSHEAYLKAPNNDASDQFGWSVAIDGDTIVVGANLESSNQTTITNGSTEMPNTS